MKNSACVVWSEKYSICVFEIGHVSMQYVLFSEICDACLGKEIWLWTVGCTAWSCLWYCPHLHTVSSHMSVAAELKCKCYNIWKNEVHYHS